MAVLGTGVGGIISVSLCGLLFLRPCDSGNLPVDSAVFLGQLYSSLAIKMFNGVPRFYTRIAPISSNSLGDVVLLRPTSRQSGSHLLSLFELTLTSNEDRLAAYI